MLTGISVECRAAKGIFASEYFAKIRMVDGHMWEGTADKEIVFNLEREPQEKDYVEGRMYAYLISFDKEAGIALIELPIEDSSAGRRIVVPFDSVRTKKIPA